MAAVGLAPGHEHAHGPRPAADARDRGHPRVARAPAQCRPERRHAVLRHLPRRRTCTGLVQPLRRLHVALVLRDLPPALPVADRLRHPAREAPREGAHVAPAPHARAALAPRGLREAHRRGLGGDGCLGPGIRIHRPRREAAAPRRLPRRAGRLARHLVGFGRARLPARDRAISSSTSPSSAC